MSEPFVLRVAAGDSDAVAAYLDRDVNPVWSLACRLTPSRSDAGDAVQEIFIELWSRAGRYAVAKASETTFGAMLARRRLIDHRRKTRRKPGMQERGASASERDCGLSPPVKTLHDEAARASRLLRTLKPDQQQVTKLAVYRGYTRQSISEALGIPLGTVKTHLRRGLMRIRSAMQVPDVSSSREART